MCSKAANGLRGGLTETDTERKDFETPEHLWLMADEGIKGFKETDMPQWVYDVKRAHSPSVLVTHSCCSKLPQT